MRRMDATWVLAGIVLLFGELSYGQHGNTPSGLPAAPGAVDAAAPSDRTAARDTDAVAGIPEDRLPVHEFSLEPAQVQIGQLITWRVQLDRRATDRVHLPSGADFGGLEVQDKNREVTEDLGERVRERFEVQLIAFEAGEFEIPAQKLTVVDADGGLGEIEIPGVQVVVASLIANEPEPGLKEDVGPGEVVVEKDYTLLWILGVLAAAGLGGLIALIVRRLWARRRPKSEPPPPPPRPAEEIALEKLAALRNSGLLAGGEFKEYHVRLSEGVREYLGNRYHFDSLELSSEELIMRVRKVRVEQTLYTLILDFLSETDLVKFAKMIPTIDESERMLDAAFHLVEETTPRISEEPPQQTVSELPSEGERL